MYNFGTVDGDGHYPFGGLTLGRDGNFYGTTESGGTDLYGTVFKLTPSGRLTTLYTFTGGTDGTGPMAPPIQGADGSLYGTASGTQSGNGAIYKITPAGVFTTLYLFDSTHGRMPDGPLVQGTDGNFYGTTAYGGTNFCDCGVIFKISPAGTFTVLGNLDLWHAAIPFSPLVQASDGNFYGTTVSGGSSGYGVVFEVAPAGKFTVLHYMNGTTDGRQTSAGLVQATDGNLYGVNGYGGAASSGCPSGCGTIFKITTTGVFSVLYNFDLTTGQAPLTTVMQHTNGILYGTASGGGTGCASANCGVLYSLNIGAAPFVSLVSTRAKLGQTVEILGQGFTGTTGVSFDGIAANFKVKSDTYLMAIVPTGAQTGPVTVTTPGGTLTSNKIFRVAP